MTNFTQLVDKTGHAFEQVIRQHTTYLQCIPTEDFGWTNYRWSSRQFRLAHVEKFQQPKFSVLHMVIFPHVYDPNPIFGFDIIASDTKATGVFFDLSPTVGPSCQLSTQTWQDPRNRPEWGDIFSDYWIACRPSLDEAQQICNLAVDTLHQYLRDLSTTASSSKIRDIIQAQNRYSLQQRKNEHTTRVILKLLGEQKGQHFIENVLFPTI